MATDQHFVCGVGLNIVLMSTDNSVSIVFSSDYSVNRAGFNTTFAPVDGRFEFHKFLKSNNYNQWENNRPRVSVICNHYINTTLYSIAFLHL